jgi:hypothetical protein
MTKLSFRGWVIILLVLYVMSKNKSMYNAIYLSLILTILLLLLGNHKSIENIMFTDEEEGPENKVELPETPEEKIEAWDNAGSGSGGIRA